MAVYMVTGVSGYLGTRILEYLEKKADVDLIIGIDIAEPKRTPAKLKMHKMDVRDPAIRDIAEKNKVDVVIHLAFILNPIRDLYRMHSIDVWGTDNILRAAKQCKAKQFFVTSSTSAYGALPDNPEPLLENHPLRAPKSYQYAYDKAAIDDLCRKFMAENPQIATTIVRPCIVMGPNVDNFISRGLTLGMRFYIGGEDPTMQFVHEKDVARACLMCIENKAHGVYNLVGEGTMKLSEVWEMAGGKLPPLSVPKWLLYGLTDSLYFLGRGGIEAPSAQLDFMRWPWWTSGEKIAKEVGFKPEFTSRQALKEFLLDNEKR